MIDFFDALRRGDFEARAGCSIPRSARRGCARSGSATPARRLLKRRMEEIVAEHSGQPLEEVSTDMERDHFLTAEAAMEYGLIDNVLARRFE
jgi:Clp protease